MNAQSFFGNIKALLSKLFASKWMGFLTSLIVLFSVPTLVNWFHQTYSTLRYGEASVKAGEHKLTLTGWMVGLGLLGMLLSPVVMMANFILPFIPGFWLLFLLGSAFTLGFGLLFKTILFLGRGVYKLFAFAGRTMVGLLEKEGRRTSVG